MVDRPGGDTSTQLLANMSLDKSHEQGRIDENKDELDQPDAQLQLARAEE